MLLSSLSSERRCTSKLQVVAAAARCFLCFFANFCRSIYGPYLPRWQQIVASDQSSCIKHRHTIIHDYRNNKLHRLTERDSRLAHFSAHEILNQNGLTNSILLFRLLPVQNLTSYSCCLTPISYIDDEISRLSCLVIEIPVLGYLGFFGFWGYLTTSGAKSDVTFLLSDPDFYKGDEISRLSRLIFEI